MDPVDLAFCYEKRHKEFHNPCLHLYVHHLVRKVGIFFDLVNIQIYTYNKCASDYEICPFCCISRKLFVGKNLKPKLLTDLCFTQLPSLFPSPPLLEPPSLAFSAPSLDLSLLPSLFEPFPRLFKPPLLLFVQTMCVNVFLRVVNISS